MDDHALVERPQLPTAPAPSRLEKIAPWIAGAIIALPVVLVHYPPMADLPLHEAVVGLLRHWGDPAYIPPNVYELNLGQPNQLFYFLILPLAYVFPIGVATKLVVALTVFLLPPAAARFADYLGVTRWTAVLLAPIGLGWLFFWGLLANLIGFVLYLTALPSLDRLCETPNRRTVSVACGWVVLLHFAHDAMSLIAVGTVALFTLCSWRSARENALRLLPSALGLAVALVSRALDARHLVKHAQTLPPFIWWPLSHKILSVPGVLYAGYVWWIRDLLFVACAVPMVLFGAERWRTRTPEKLAWGKWLHHFRFELLSGCLLFAYLAAPASMSSTTLIYHRFMAPAWAVLTVTLATRDRRAAWRLPRLIAAMIPIAPILTSWPLFLRANETAIDLDAAITHMNKNSTYIVLELGPTEEFHLSSALTELGHVVASLGGRGFFDFSESPAAPVMLRREIMWTDSFERIDGHSYRFYPSYDLKRYHYAILHTPDQVIAAVVVLAMEPEAHFVFHQGDWTVMESTLPQVPLDSPDEPGPVPPPPDLHERALAAHAAVLKSGSKEHPVPPDTSAPSAEP